MGVPADEADRPDPRAVGLGKKAGRGAGGFRKIGPHPGDAGSRKRSAIDHGSIRWCCGAKRGQTNPCLERGRQFRIGVFIEIEQPGLGVFVGRQQFLRHP